MPSWRRVQKNDKRLWSWPYRHTRRSCKCGAFITGSDFLIDGGVTAECWFGDSAQLIEKAKEILTTTNLTVSEIAYQLGFEYLQSFSKLFKSKTNLTPIEYRHSYN